MTRALRNGCIDKLTLLLERDRTSVIDSQFLIFLLQLYLYPGLGPAPLTSARLSFSLSDSKYFHGIACLSLLSGLFLGNSRIGELSNRRSVFSCWQILCPQYITWTSSKIFLRY